NNIELKIDPTIIFATLKDIQDLETKIDTTKTELTSNIETAKTELNNKIGDTTQLTTTDKINIVSALNEVKTSVDSIETTAEKTSYNNATSNLTATNVQGAIDEVVAKIEKFNNENIKIQNDMLPI
ncbi:phage tail protein, partial [Clostridioides difficile]|nr:phage tail protein [Clostridioides difficile]